MTNDLEQLYLLVNEKISDDCAYREKVSALGAAKLALLEQMDALSDRKIAPLLDVYSLLDGERQVLHERALFEATLSLGMELGRLGSTA